jgi:hypothetical protein
LQEKERSMKILIIDHDNLIDGIKEYLKGEVIKTDSLRTPERVDVIIINREQFNSEEIGKFIKIVPQGVSIIGVSRNLMMDEEGFMCSFLVPIDLQKLAHIIEGAAS